jgi:tRNA threonylcarbamoyladenosine biosynthesis protein TsaB
MQSSSGPRPDTPTLHRPHILALDTSTERLAVALQAAGGPWLALVDGGALASARLLPQVAALLAQAGLAYADLDVIAFGRGPGAFTGLRTACSAAQGLAFGLGKPVLPIDSLLIVAEDARMQYLALPQVKAGSLRVAVAMDARMDEVYAGIYGWAAQAWQVIQAPGLYSLAGLHEAWTGVEVDVLAGSALAAFGPRLIAPAAAHCVPTEQDRAAALLRLAVLAAGAGAACPADEALPLYLRDKVAQTTAERAAVKAAQAAQAAQATQPALAGPAGRAK